MVTAVYPGSFDPVTVGHMDVATRAAQLFTTVIIAVYETPEKNLIFTAEERVKLLQTACEHLPNVEVAKFSGLMVRFAKDAGAEVIVRGLRSGSDFEYEIEMAAMNRKLDPAVDLVCFMTAPEYMFVSASLLKEVAKLGGDITDMVPPNVAEAVYQKFGLPVMDV